MIRSAVYTVWQRAALLVLLQVGVCRGGQVGVCRGGQVGERREPQFWWQLKFEPFINRVKYFPHIWWLLFLSVQVQQFSFS